MAENAALLRDRHNVPASASAAREEVMKMTDPIEVIRRALLDANEDVYGPEGNEDALAALDVLARERLAARTWADLAQEFVAFADTWDERTKDLRDA